jgi:hypothetical protein
MPGGIGGRDGGLCSDPHRISGRNGDCRGEFTVKKPITEQSHTRSYPRGVKRKARYGFRRSSGQSR